MSGTAGGTARGGAGYTTTSDPPRTPKPDGVRSTPWRPTRGRRSRRPAIGSRRGGPLREPLAGEPPTHKAARIGLSPRTHSRVSDGLRRGRTALAHSYSWRRLPLDRRGCDLELARKSRNN